MRLNKERFPVISEIEKEETNSATPKIYLENIKEKYPNRVENIGKKNEKKIIKNDKNIKSGINGTTKIFAISPNKDILPNLKAIYGKTKICTAKVILKTCKRLFKIFFLKVKNSSSS